MGRHRRLAFRRHLRMERGGAAIGPETASGSPNRILFLTGRSAQLVTCRWDAYRFWDLPSMENVLTLCRTNRPLPDPIVISSSGRWAAVSLRPHETDLVQLPSGKSILRLGGPRMNPVVLGFSPDESKIVVGNAENPMVGVWDLRELSQELAELDSGARGIGIIRSRFVRVARGS